MNEFLFQLDYWNMRGDFILSGATISFILMCFLLLQKFPLAVPRVLSSRTVCPVAPHGSALSISNNIAHQQLPKRKTTRTTTPKCPPSPPTSRCGAAFR